MPNRWVTPVSLQLTPHTVFLEAAIPSALCTCHSTARRWRLGDVEPDGKLCVLPSGERQQWVPMQFDIVTPPPPPRRWIVKSIHFQCPSSRNRADCAERVAKFLVRKQCAVTLDGNVIGSLPAPIASTSNTARRNPVREARLEAHSMEPTVATLSNARALSTSLSSSASSARTAATRSEAVNGTKVSRGSEAAARPSAAACATATRPEASAAAERPKTPAVAAFHKALAVAAPTNAPSTPSDAPIRSDASAPSESTSEPTPRSILNGGCASRGSEGRAYGKRSSEAISILLPHPIILPDPPTTKRHKALPNPIKPTPPSGGTDPGRATPSSVARQPGNELTFSEVERMQAILRPRANERWVGPLARQGLRMLARDPPPSRQDLLRALRPRRAGLRHGARNLFGQLAALFSDKS